jgi:hypothetical protein
MLIQEIQIGKEGITVNHIVPINKNGVDGKNALLYTGCRGLGICQPKHRGLKA